LGENIGTTITANLAALTANTSARRAALAHFMFNVFGVLWMLVLFYPFTGMISYFVDTYMASDPQVAVSFKLSAFHTAFNICNVCIMIWFVKLIEKTVCLIIQKRRTPSFQPPRSKPDERGVSGVLKILAFFWDGL
jgi:phosphate:Na+ symporter